MQDRFPSVAVTATAFKRGVSAVALAMSGFSNSSTNGSADLEWPQAPKRGLGTLARAARYGAPLPAHEHRAIPSVPCSSRQLQSRRVAHLLDPVLNRPVQARAASQAGRGGPFRHQAGEQVHNPRGAPRAGGSGRRPSPDLLGVRNALVPRKPDSERSRWLPHDARCNEFPHALHATHGPAVP